MARARKRHVQQELFKPRGGKRRGAGRPPKGRRSSERHKKRPFHNERHPVHVTIRVAEDLGTLRKRDMFKAIHRATERAMRADKFRIVHLTMQSNHLHLIAEAKNKTLLSRGMQSFQISAAKRINAAMSHRTGERRRGRVFVDRYHARALTTPRSVRNAISYVLRGSIKRRVDAGSRSGDLRSCCVSPETRLGQWFVEHVATPSPASSQTALSSWTEFWAAHRWPFPTLTQHETSGVSSRN